LKDVPRNDPDDDDSERISVAKHAKRVLAKLIPLAVDEEGDFVVDQEHLLIVLFFISLVAPLTFFLLLLLYSHFFYVS